MLKKFILSVVTFISILAILGYWFVRMFADELSVDYSDQQAHNLPYIQQSLPTQRGKILAVVTNTKTMGPEHKQAGYELTELSRAYYVFKVNGFEVDIASPLGGEPPMVRDDDDMGAFDFAFLNDPTAMAKVKNTLSVSQVDAADYQAVYFVGGKGTMFDFPNNPDIQRLVRQFWLDDKVVSAVCHGPAALINVMLDNNQYLLENKHIAAFTNEEELLFIPEAETIFPYLLQTKLEDMGAKFEAGPMYLNNVVVDGKLITGQNPWSVWELAEQVIVGLGYTPVARTKTAEENSVTILKTFKTKGYDVAMAQLLEMQLQYNAPINKTLIATHAFLALLTFDLSQLVGLISLLSTSNLTTE